MKPALARALCRLYPRRWRHRYGAEFVALLEALPCEPATIADAMFAALRMRSRAIAATGIVVAGVAFVIASALHSTASHAVPSAHAYSLSHKAAPAACRTYSSVSNSGYVSSQRCLD